MQPETIGLMDMGALCIFLRKYKRWVLTSLSRFRNSEVVLSICFFCFICSVRWLIARAREGV